MNFNNKYTCCVLALGNLGEPAKISLFSLKNIDSETICVLSDEVGRAWMIENSSEEIRAKLCFHSNSEINRVLSDLEQSSDYVTFGSNRFFTLMILKWLLMLDCLLRHKELIFCIYTDLDVYWRLSPKKIITSLLDREIIALVQDDSTLDGKREFFCPGIMVWKNDKFALNEISNIYEIQKREIASGNPFPDDKALNRWLNQDNNRRRIKPLPKETFVIGHRFIWLMLGVKRFALRKTIAFHGNYSIGIEEKTLLMKGASLPVYSPKRYYFAFLIIRRKLFY